MAALRNKRRRAHRATSVAGAQARCSAVPAAPFARRRRRHGLHPSPAVGEREDGLAAELQRYKQRLVVAMWSESHAKSTIKELTSAHDKLSVRAAAQAIRARRSSAPRRSRTRRRARRARRARRLDSGARSLSAPASTKRRRRARASSTWSRRSAICSLSSI